MSGTPVYAVAGGIVNGSRYYPSGDDLHFSLKDPKEQWVDPETVLP